MFVKDLIMENQLYVIIILFNNILTNQILGCQDCGSMCHPECIGMKDFDPLMPSSFKCSNCFTHLSCEESLSDMQHTLLEKRHGYNNDYEEEPNIIKKMNFGMDMRNFY